MVILLVDTIVVGGGWFGFDAIELQNNELNDVSCVGFGPCAWHSGSGQDTRMYKMLI